MSEDKDYLSHVDFGVLLKKLTACAVKMFIKMKCCSPDRVLPGVAQSPQDLAQNALMTFFNEDKWRPKISNEDPFPYILMIMRNDFMDLLKSSAHKKTANQEEYDQLRRFAKASVLSVKINDVDKKILKEQLYKLVGKEKDLRDYLDAVFELGLEKRENIAEILGLEPKEVTNLSRRLVYTLKERLKQ